RVGGADARLVVLNVDAARFADCLGQCVTGNLAPLVVVRTDVRHGEVGGPSLPVRVVSDERIGGDHLDAGRVSATERLDHLVFVLRRDDDGVHLHGDQLVDESNLLVQ